MLSFDDRKWIAKMLWLTMKVILTNGYREEWKDKDDNLRKVFIDAAQREDLQDDRHWEISFIMTQGQGPVEGTHYVVAPHSWGKDEIKARFLKMMKGVSVRIVSCEEQHQDRDPQMFAVKLSKLKVKS